MFLDRRQQADFESVVEAGAIYLTGLEDYVSVAENYDVAEVSGVVDGVERLGEKTVGEGIVDHEIGNFEQLRVAGQLDAITLEGSQVVGVTEFGAELLKDLPIALG